MRRISILYAIMKPCVNWAIRLFYRNLHVRNSAQICNVGAPVLLISNHQNALMDPLLCCITSPKQLNFLARADVFKNPVAKKVLTGLNMLPVYRPHDKVNIIESNAPTFRESLTRLENNQIISLFPEGTHQPDQNLKPFKKGAARLIGDVFDAGKCDKIIIQPVGLHFTNIMHSGYPGFVHYGEQMLITADELDLTPENRSKMVLGLTRRLSDSLEKCVIHINADEQYSRKLFVFRTRQWSALFSKKGGSIPEFKAIEAELVNYTSSLEGHISDAEITELENSSFGMPALVLAADESLRKRFGKKLLFLTPVYFVGYLVTAIPYFIGKKLASKMVKDVCFTSSAKIVIGTVIIPLFWAVLLVIARSVFHTPMVYVGFVFTVFCGAIFLKYHTSYRIFNLSKRMNKSEEYTSLIAAVNRTAS